VSNYLFVLQRFICFDAFCANLAKGWTSFIYILKGSVSIGSDTNPHEAFHTLVLSAQGNETGVSLTAAEDNTEFVLVRIYPI
jgi:redox-sensitive bicupin YhaK (pirin superfamily)